MTDDPQLARLLDAWVPLPLPAGFTDRLVARVEAGQALPPATPRRHRLRVAWSRTPRYVTGGVAIGLMTATAAAAAGVFGNVGITIPAWQRTVEKVTGIELAEVEPVAPQAATAQPPAADTAEPAPTLRDIVADGKIESRAELEAAAKMVDAQRAERLSAMRERQDARIDRRVAERRIRGLPTPSDEQIAAHRARRDQRATVREGIAAARREEEREAIGRRLDNGETIDIEAERARAREQLDQRLTPRQRERLERWRARRGGQSQDSPQTDEQDLAEPDPAPKL